ncbi:MAG TPA: hypothetical protein VFP54_02170 [Acidimicrobiales bacterium]|nr:hypothetical protein [Acidimicrobiales bacterium]
MTAAFGTVSAGWLAAGWGDGPTALPWQQLGVAGLVELVLDADRCRRTAWWADAYLAFVSEEWLDATLQRLRWRVTRARGTEPSGGGTPTVTATSGADVGDRGRQTLESPSRVSAEG